MTPPTFSHKKVLVIYVLGGPGAGELRHLTSDNRPDAFRPQAKVPSVTSWLMFLIFVISQVRDEQSHIFTLTY